MKEMVNSVIYNEWEKLNGYFTFPRKVIIVKYSEKQGYF